MSEWEYYKLGELTEIGSSKRIFSSEYQDEGVPFWRGKEITELGSGKAVSTELFISEKKYNDIKSKHGVPSEGDILVTSVGTIGNVYQVKASDKFYFKDGNVTWIKKFNPKISSLFLYKWFNSNLAKREINAVLIGSTQQALTISALKELSIQIPEKSIQVEIANIIDNLDQKITLLREQNQTLEELAQALFKRWFVEFEFPNENGQPYKSSGGKMVESELGEIPEGWELHPLEDLVKVHNGYSYKGAELQESNVAMVTLKNFDRNGGFRFDGFKELVSDRYKEKHVVNVGDLIVAHTDLTQDAEVLGNPALIMKNEKYIKLVVSMDLVKVESKHKSLNTEFLYYLMRDKRFKYHCKGYANGTTVLHLSKSAIPEYLFPFPKDITLIENFGAYAYSVYQKISNNIEEIQSLTQLRDTLLPKLMSGELKINS